MAFPDIDSYPTSHPGPYERNMGGVIANLLQLFNDFVVDRESAAQVNALAIASDRWSAGHGVFDEIRHRANALPKPRDPKLSAQYGFEEMCCKAMYNATCPEDPFDPSAPFYVAEAAFDFAQAVGLSDASVVQVFCRCAT